MEWNGAAGVIFVVFIVPADLEEKKKYLKTILVAENVIRKKALCLFYTE